MGDSAGSPRNGKVLLVQLEKDQAARITEALGSRCQSIHYAQLEYEALQLLALTRFDLVIQGEYARRIDAQQTVHLIRRSDPDVPLLLLRANPAQAGSPPAGPFEIMTADTPVTELAGYVCGLLAADDVQRQLRQVREKLRDLYHLEALIGWCPPMQDVFRAVQRVASSTATVLIQGESGTGKELVAREIHQLSDRKEQPFVTVNCAAIPETLLESELFGHEKGAFTGATGRRAGKFEQADGGTLFLDEIGEMTQATQSKILRVLQEQSYERVGGNETVHVSVRIITATNRNLEEEVRKGRFRQDLFYRVYVYPIHLPSLKARMEDIPLLATHFILRASQAYKRPIRGISPAAVEKLQAHAWPGNVRELQNVIERAVLICQSAILGPDHILFSDSTLLMPQDEAGPPAPGNQPEIAIEGLQHDGDILPLDEVERRYLLYTLKQVDGNISKAAHLLQIGRATLYRKLEKYHIDFSS